ncbi:BAI1-associated protein 3-like [Parasteatoda tepidariorum]|uniref:BAI1-associated protein 3-like n=1 Tax=Parasteatoda tepidariorum TaxID=114398 RepID=UPI00077FB1CC|nr:uncharacterized protein LOC107444024 [Parasteatoda tepidariorum]
MMEQKKGAAENPTPETVTRKQKPEPKPKTVEEDKDVGAKSERDDDTNPAAKSSNQQRDKLDSCIGFRSHDTDSDDDTSVVDSPCKDHSSSILFNLKKSKKIHRKLSWPSDGKLEDNFSKKLSFNFPQFRLSRVDNLLASTSSQKTLEMLTVVAAYSIYHHFGTSPQEIDQSELISYLHELSPIGSSLIKKCLDKAKALPAPNFALYVKIKEACGLKHNMSSKYGHPFCKVWLVSASRNYEYTEMMDNDDHPVWNKEFYFSLKDPNKETLMIEVWDNDEEGIIESDTTVKTKFCWPCIACKNSCFGGDTKLSVFIGLFQIELKNLSMEGTDEWVVIKSRTRKVEKGRLRVQIKIGVSGIKTNVDIFKRHMLLIKECLYDGLKNHTEDENPIYCLEDIIPPPGMILIFLHSVISGLSECEDAVCKFIVFNRTRSQNFAIPLRVIFRLINETGDCIDQKCFEGSLENTLEDMYRKEAESLHDKCFTMLNALHTFDLANNKRHLDDFEFSLRCIHTCQEMLLISSAPLKSLKSEAQDWTELKREEIKEAFPDDEAKYTMELLDYLIYFHKAADKVIKRVYPDETYTKFTFDSLNLLSDPLKTLVNTFIERTEESKEDRLTNIEKGLSIFSKLKQFVKYIVRVTQKEEEDLQICQFQKWFGENFFTMCFQERLELTKSMTVDAVNADDRTKLDTSVDGRKLQNESVDILLEIMRKNLTNLWKIISYPRSSKCDLLFADAMYITCLKYYSAKRKAIEQQCEQRTFGEKDFIDLCILANNLWALASGVEDIITDTVEDLPPDAEDSKKRLEKFCRLVSQEISEIIIRDIRVCVREITGSETCEAQDSAIKDYEEYLKKRMQTINSNSLPGVSRCVQLELWNNVLVLMGQYVMKPVKSDTKLTKFDEEEEFKKDLNHKGYFKILSLSRSLIFSDQEETQGNIADNKLYKELLENIEINLKE